MDWWLSPLGWEGIGIVQDDCWEGLHGTGIYTGLGRGVVCWIGGCSPWAGRGLG